MGFRLFGVNVEIQVGFWISTALLGWHGQSSGRQVLVWVAVVFVSILAHEFGHALAVRRHRIEPEISLHWMGGTTSFRPLLPLTRRDQIVISLAGPFAGFVLAGLVYALFRLSGVAIERLPPMAELAVSYLLFVNLYWGIVNLAPVLPFDGGHVLEAALGPRRERLATGISLIAGGALAAWFLLREPRSVWAGLLFGMAALQSYQRYRASEARMHRPAAARAQRPDAAASHVSQEEAGLIRQARAALEDERFDLAHSLARRVLDGEASLGREAGAPAASPAAIHAALEIMCWVHVMAGRFEEAARTLQAVAALFPPDAALAGAVARGRGDDRAARRIFEEARARGDDRKEVVGPLIQILLGQGEVARAAAVAVDIIDSLSDDDARRMARIAFEAGCFEWAARLSEAVFRREGRAEDAYEAARALAQDGEVERATEFLRRAVAAGFHDRERARADAALTAIRAQLESILPRGASPS